MFERLAFETPMQIDNGCWFYYRQMIWYALLSEKNMILKFVLMLFVALSVGCAHVGKSDVIKVEGAIKTTPSLEKKAPEAEAKVVEPSKLDAALLYSLLGGEVAGQRGNVNMASAFYVDAAKRSNDPQVALRAAQIAMYNKDVVAAKSAIDILVAGGDLSLQSHRLALTVYLRSGDAEKSLSQITSIIQKSDIPQRNALLAIGDIVSRNATKDVANKVINGLIDRYSEEAAIYLARSQISSHFGELEQAEEDAIKVTKLDSSWPVGFAQLALLYERKGETDRALVVLKNAAERLKARPLVMGYGQLLAKNEQYEEAREQFLILLSHEESYPEASFALGLVYLKLDNAIEATKIFKNLYEKKVFSSKSAFYLGRIHYYQKEYEDALLWFGRVSKGAHYIDSHASIAMIKSETGDLQGARSVLQRLRNEYPKDSTRFYLLEAELLMDGQHNKLLYELLTVAINENPDNLSLRYARSIAATELDKLAVAEKDLLFVLEKEPKDVNALNALGYTLASKTFRFKEARRYLAQALSLRPADPAILDSMGWLNYREGHYEDALVLLKKAYSKTPEGEIAAHLGETLWMLGRQKEARAVWEEGLKRDSDNRYLIEVLKRLK